MFLKKEIRIRVAVLLVTVLALASAPPAGAVGWGEAREWSREIMPLVLSWLGLGPCSKCEDGAGADPHGWLPKLDQGSQIDPDGHR